METINKSELKDLGTNVPHKLRRLRRLTPLEAYRLMAFSDEDFYRAKYGKEFPYELLEKKQRRTCTKIEWKELSGFMRSAESNGEVMSDSQLYSQAGNSIGVNCLVAIFGQLFEGHERDYVSLYHDRYEK